MLETLSVRLDAPAQAARRHPFSESFDSFHCAAHDVVDFLDQALLRVIHAGKVFPGRPAWGRNDDRHSAIAPDSLEGPRSSPHPPYGGPPRYGSSPGLDS